MSAPAAPQTSWTSHDVPPAAIEGELERLWQRAQAQLAPVKAKAGDGPPAVARARVLNFVAYAQDEASAGLVMAQVELLAIHHHSRTIVIVAHEEAARQELRATVSIRAQLTGDGRRILHEHVEIDAHGEVEESLPSIVVPLLIPDLPTYLWWPGDLPVGHSFWRRMVDACDRLILNSGDFTAPLEGMSRFAEFYRRGRRFHTFGDLNWHRLTQWRELIAQFFDNQTYRPFLDLIDEVLIEYSSRPEDGTKPTPNPSGGLLLASWLCAKLGWECSACQVTEGTLRYELVGWPSGRTLSLVLQEGAAGAEAGRIDYVQLSVSATPEGAVFSVKRDEASQVAHALASLAGVPGTPRIVSMSSSGYAPLLASELQGRGHDEIYEATLAVAGALAREAHRQYSTQLSEVSRMVDAREQAQILIAPNMDELVQMTATGILDAAIKTVAEQGTFSIALSGGSTPRLLYQKLATPPIAGEMPWAHVQLFWGDERHVPPDHPDSNYRMTREALLDHVPVPPENIHRIPCELPNAATAAVAYADELRRAFHLDEGEIPRFDLILLGMGEDGHTASLFPHSPALDEQSALVTANPVAKLNTTRITLTLPVLNNGARIWFLVAGGTKAQVLRDVLEGPIQPETLPSQLIAPTDGELYFLLDNTAAAALSPGLRAGAVAGLG